MMEEPASEGASAAASATPRAKLVSLLGVLAPRVERVAPLDRGPRRAV